jgi:hypothetical protein
MVVLCLKSEHARKRASIAVYVWYIINHSDTMVMSKSESGDLSCIDVGQIKIFVEIVALLMSATMVLFGDLYTVTVMSHSELLESQPGHNGWSLLFHGTLSRSRA